ncbi:UNKNOWN [Stylonychia lemnae]|uniref:STIL N-terminal domain-containing protein n=1 Tax=Stylonychia lemnae TaxID=5949 RepID=A0A078B971_STYLE|nr:UNKNOWN [Stylonychia lemnae]|eukprot:CDW90113.1 UNKNOWN [Stylonychia lemnae]
MFSLTPKNQKRRRKKKYSDARIIKQGKGVQLVVSMGALIVNTKKWKLFGVSRLIMKTLRFSKRSNLLTKLQIMNNKGFQQDNSQSRKAQKVTNKDQLHNFIFVTQYFPRSSIQRECGEERKLLVQKYSKSLLDQVCLSIESEEINPYSSDKIIFKNLTEDSVLQHGKVSLKGQSSSPNQQKKTIKVQLCSSLQFKNQQQEFLKLAYDHNNEIQSLKNFEFEDQQDKENLCSNRDNQKLKIKESIPQPIDFLAFQSNICICRSKGKIEFNLNILAPNISFDFYQISQIKIASNQFLPREMRESSDIKAGFLQIDSETKVTPINFNDSDILKNEMVGIWLSNLPVDDKQTPLQRIKDPLVWSACLKFVMLSEKFNQVNSPSSDKNTFLVILFEQNFSKSLCFEFKILRNEPDKSYLNNWMVMTFYKKFMRQSSEPYYDNFQLRPQIFKKQTQFEADKFKIYTFNKFLQKSNEIQQQQQQDEQQNQMPQKENKIMVSHQKTQSEQRSKVPQKNPTHQRQLAQSAKRLDRNNRRVDSLMNQSEQDSLQQNSTSAANSQISNRKSLEKSRNPGAISRIARSNSQKAVSRVKEVESDFGIKQEPKTLKRSGSEVKMSTEQDQHSNQINKLKGKIKIKSQSQNSLQEISQSENSTNKNSSLNDNNQQSATNFIQMIGGASQRQNLNIGRYVPTLKMMNIQSNQQHQNQQSQNLQTPQTNIQIKQSQISSITTTSQVSPFIKKGNIMRSSNDRQINSVSSSNQVFSPCMTLATPQNRDFDLRSSAKSSVLRVKDHNKADNQENPYQTEEPSRNPLTFVRGSFTEFQTPIVDSKFNNLQSKDVKFQSEIFQSQVNTQMNDEFNIQKKLKFEEYKNAEINQQNDNLIFQNEDIVDYSDVIEKTRSSPTTKNIMRSQARSIKVLQQQVNQLTKIVQELTTKSGNGNSSKNSSSNSNSGYSNLFSTGVTQKSKSIEKDEGGLSKANTLDNRVPPKSDINQPSNQIQQNQIQQQQQNQQQSPEKQQINEDKIIQAFVDFLRQSQQTNNEVNQLFSIYGGSQGNNTENRNSVVGDPRNPQLSQSQQFNFASAAKGGSINIAPPKILRPMSVRQNSKEDKQQATQLNTNKNSFSGLLMGDHEHSQHNIILDNCQESPINHKNATTFIDNLNNSQNFRETSSGSIKEEESHCLKKLTRVLSQRIETYEKSKGRKAIPPPLNYVLKSNQVFDMQTKQQDQVQASLKSSVGPYPFNNAGLVFEFEESIDEESSIGSRINNPAQPVNKFKRKSNEGDQADDENETYKSSEISLAQNKNKIPRNL